MEQHYAPQREPTGGQRHPHESSGEKQGGEEEEASVREQGPGAEGSPRRATAALS